MGVPEDSVDMTERLAAAARRIADRGTSLRNSAVRPLPVLQEAGVELPPTLTIDPPDVSLASWDGAGSGIDADNHTGRRALAREILSSGDHSAALEDTELVGRFRIWGELGRGGMGRVLEARDPDLRRNVAVKLLLEGAKIGQQRLARFVAEAQITSQLEHPNIVPVHEMGVTDEGRIFFVMKKVGGQSMRDVLDAVRRGKAGVRERWTRRRLLTVFVQVCQAVAYAHERGVLHRDLKPPNVMLGEFGEVLVMDWGLARLVGDEREELVEVSGDPIEMVAVRKTLDGAAIGTPGYMSPEQVQGSLAELDERADIWSLGAILYEMLTWRRPYNGEQFEMMVATLKGPPTPPCERVPERGIPQEVADVAMRAMAPKRADRYAKVTDLIAAVEAFLEGSQRRQQAASRLAVGEEHWALYAALGLEEGHLREREKALSQEVQSWAPLDDPKKAEMHQLRERLEELGTEQATHFGKAIAAAEQALSQDPGNAEAREFLARAYWGRFEQAEARRDAREQAFYADRVTEYDGGVYAARLRGAGSVSLQTSPVNAEVWCQRYSQRGLVWQLEAPTLLGSTPLAEAPLAMGTYLLTLRAPGYPDVLYPVRMSRNRHWEPRRAVPLFTEDEIGQGFTYVPEGPAVFGGDIDAANCPPAHERELPGFFIATDHVTAQDYCDFLNALHIRDPAAAWERAPREQAGLDQQSSRMWARPTDGGYEVPTADVDGDRWDPQWPVCGISWSDAIAYAAWASPAKVHYGLPPEDAWEKAARGVDGRLFPWGDLFDATLCCMTASQQTGHSPTPIGTFEFDRSPYGVRDLAGSMREWSGDANFDGDVARRPVRGGAWSSALRQCRTANRFGFEPDRIHTYVGFRLFRWAP